MRYFQIQKRRLRQFLSQLYQEFGDNGIITAAVQISHKYHRFMNLIKGTPAKVNESLRDTLLDLANYCVLTVMELDKAKEKANASALSALLRLFPPLHIVQLRSLITASISLTTPSSPPAVLPPPH